MEESEENVERDFLSMSGFCMKMTEVLNGETGTVERSGRDIKSATRTTTSATFCPYAVLHEDDGCVETGHLK